MGGIKKILGGLFRGGKAENTAEQVKAAVEEKVDAEPQVSEEDLTRAIMEKNDASAKRVVLELEKAKIRAAEAGKNRGAELLQFIDEQLEMSQDELERPLSVPHDLGKYDEILVSAIEKLPDIVRDGEEADIRECVELLCAAMGEVRRSKNESKRFSGKTRLCIIIQKAAILAAENAEKDFLEQFETVTNSGMSAANKTALMSELTVQINTTRDQIEIYKAKLGALKLRLNQLMQDRDHLKMSQVAAVDEELAKYMEQELEETMDFIKRENEKLVERKAIARRREKKYFETVKPVTLTADEESVKRYEAMFAQMKNEKQGQKEAQAEKTQAEQDVAAEQEETVDPLKL